MTIEERIRALEKQFSPYEGSIAGTTLSRVLLDHKLFEEQGLDPERTTGRESSLVWNLALGAIQLRKEFFYGHTIEEVVEKAEKVYDTSR